MEIKQTELHRIAEKNYDDYSSLPSQIAKYCGVEKLQWNQERKLDRAQDVRVSLMAKDSAALSSIIEDPD